jgi:hypothetical protein
MATFVLETIAITESPAYITLTWSGGRINHIPKGQLAIVFNDDNPVNQKVILTWPSGTNKQSFDTVRLGYGQISSPTLASDAELLTLLVGYADAAASVSSGAAGGGSIVYTNAAGDFVATPTTGSKVITISGLTAFTLDYINLIGGSIKKIAAAGGDPVNLYTGTTSIAISGNDITLADIDDFTAGDIVYVTLIGPDKNRDAALDSEKSVTQNPEWAHYIDPVHLVDDSNATVDQHYSAPIIADGYRGIGFHFVGDSDTSGVTFKIFGTLNPAAATPADGDALPDLDWFDMTTAITGGATVVLDGGNAAVHFAANQMPYKYIIQYEPDHATNETDIFIRKY